MKLPKLHILVAVFQRFSRREKLLLYAAAGFVGLIAADRLLVQPVFRIFSEQDTEISRKESLIRKNLRILAMKDRITQESLKYTPLVNKIDFGEEDVASLLKEIENLSNKSGVDILNIRPQGKKSLSALKTYLVTLNCEGTMEELTGFMYYIENSSSLMAISKFQLTPKSKESELVSCGISIHKIIME